MSSIAFTNTPQSKTAAPSTAWKRLWRTDAVANLIFSDMLTFAAIPIQKTLDLPTDAVTPLRVIGVFFVVYSLLQLWFTRHGEPPRQVYFLAAVDYALFGAGCAAVLIAGVEMNALGTGLTVALCAGGFIVAGLYYLRSRQLV